MTFTLCIPCHILESRCDGTLYDSYCSRRTFRPFPNYLWPLFQSESWCSPFIWKLVFICTWMKTNFHICKLSTRTRFEKEAKGNSEIWPITCNLDRTVPVHTRNFSRGPGILAMTMPPCFLDHENHKAANNQESLTWIKDHQVTIAVREEARKRELWRFPPLLSISLPSLVYSSHW